MKINEKWILLEDRKPELKYRSVYADAQDGEIAEEEESERVLVLSADGDIGTAYYNTYRVKGDDGIRETFPGIWFRTQKLESGITNAGCEETDLTDIYAWQPLPEIF